MNLINVLIVDDSEEFASSLSRSIVDGRINATVCPSAEEALKLVGGSKKFDLFLVDCMLPKMNGIDFAKKIRTEIPSSKVILMSGIFKDSIFSNQMKSEDCVDEFLVKPFETEEVKKFIRKNWDNIAVSEFSDLYPFLKVFTNYKSVIDFLANNDKLNSYSLPKILYSLLQFNINGTLSFKRDQLEVEVTISNRKITRVSSSDHSTTFGKLLVKLGFIKEAALEEFLTSDASKDTNLPMGKKLERNNLISPHASILVNKYQMESRLTTLFESGDIEIKFNEHDITLIDDSHLNIENIEALTQVWATHNISHTWLKDAFVTIKSQSPVLTQNENTSVHLERLQRGLANNDPIELINPDIDEAELFKSLFYAFSLNIINLGKEALEGVDSDAIAFDLETLQKLTKEFQGKNYFEILKATPDMTDKEIHKKYHLYAKTLHPDKLPLNSSDELKTLADDVFTLISEAYNNIKSREARVKYQETTKQNKTNELFENEKLVLEAKGYLLKSKYKAAFAILNNQTIKKNPPQFFEIYYCWAHVKTQPQGPKQDDAITAFNAADSMIKDSAEGYFVRSLIKLKDEDIAGFEDLLKICLKKEPTFLPARRELSIVKSKFVEKAPNTNTSWNIFSKKSS